MVTQIAAASLTLAAGCGGGAGTVSRDSQAQGHTEINPQPRDRIRDGGDLRLPLSFFPNSLRYNYVDGASVPLNRILHAVLPYLVSATADGGYTIDHDYLVDAKINSTAPQVVTYTINPKATWFDGTPITYRDFEAYQPANTVGYDQLLKQGNAELDDTKRAAIGNHVDRLIWKQALSVILYARPGAMAVRANRANFGAEGFADPDYINAGFIK